VRDPKTGKERVICIPDMKQRRRHFCNDRGESKI
jgi:hypothetical protein